MNSQATFCLLLIVVLFLFRGKQVFTSGYGNIENSPVPTSPTEPPHSECNPYELPHTGQTQRKPEYSCSDVGRRMTTPLDPGPCFCAPPAMRFLPGGVCVPYDYRCPDGASETPCVRGFTLSNNNAGGRETVCTSTGPRSWWNPSQCYCAEPGVVFKPKGSSGDFECVTGGTCRSATREFDVPLEIKCQNMHPTCDYWASVRECDKNPAFMQRQCHLACTRDGSCGPRYAFSRLCGDGGKHTRCNFWATQQNQCKANYAYMRWNCADECADFYSFQQDPEVNVVACGLRLLG